MTYHSLVHRLRVLYSKIHINNPAGLDCEGQWYAYFCNCVLHCLNLLQPPPKKRDMNPSGLGKAIINRKAKDARERHESGLVSDHRKHILTRFEIPLPVHHRNRLHYTFEVCDTRARSR